MSGGGSKNKKKPEFTQAMINTFFIITLKITNYIHVYILILQTTYIHKLKGASDDIENVFRIIYTDCLLESFNWDGRGEKHALGELNLIETILRGK